MVDAGMDAFRINTAYGTIEEYEKICANIWSCADIPAVIDIKGSEVRLNVSKPFQLGRGEIVSIGFGKKNKVSFTRNIISQLKVGDIILLDKGAVKSKLVSKSKDMVNLKLNGVCKFRDGLGVNFPNRNLDIPPLSKKDLNVIKFCKRVGVDYIALSFTRDEQDILALRKALRGTDIGVIAKIENSQGLENIEGIISVSDGVMIARGDLGVEIPSQKIPLLQKDIIVRCNQLGKISIVATEMLHSMVDNPIPTRAETSDVANAVLDGADCVMLSAESAVGKHPVKSVSALTDIALECETHLPCKPLDEQAHDLVSLAISKAVTTILDVVDVDKIVVATHSGYTAMLISNFRVDKDIIALTADKCVRRKLNLVYAVTPIYHPYFRGAHKVRKIGAYLFSKKLLRKNDLVLFTAGGYSQKPSTNTIHLHRVRDLIL